MAKVITYECKECGCEIIVSGSHESHLRPIYCCGTEVEKVPASKRKKPPMKTAGKTMKKKAPAKKKASRK